MGGKKMNKQEAIELLQDMAKESFELAKIHAVHIDSIVEVVNEIDEPQKPTVPSVALEYYEAYVDKLTGFDEWFGDFFDRSFLEDFPKAEELSEWLYDNDTKTNRKMELALATLIANGPSAVKVEHEKLYTVEIPNPNSHNHSKIFLHKDNQTGKVFINKGNFNETTKINQLTEQEIRKDFDWAWELAKEVTE